MKESLEMTGVAFHKYPAKHIIHMAETLLLLKFFWGKMKHSYHSQCPKNSCPIKIFDSTYTEREGFWYRTKVTLYKGLRFSPSPPHRLVLFPPSNKIWTASAQQNLTFVVEIYSFIDLFIYWFSIILNISKVEI